MKQIAVGLVFLWSSLFFEGYGNDLFISGEFGSSGLNVVISAPGGFTDRVEVYASPDLTSNNWSIVTQNLRPTGDAPATWHMEATNDNGFFIVGNMDVDNDEDGLPDAREKYVHKTNPNAADSDADGMSDGWELQHLLNPLSDADAATDLDGDELNNLEEYQEGTDPTLSDTDGDGLIDPYDLHACLFDYPVVGNAIFNMVATGYSRDYLPAIGFSSDGEQKLTLRWSDSFWYPADYRNEGRIIEAGSSQLHWTGEKFPDQNQNGWEYLNLYKDNFWYDLGSRNWDPPLTYPMCYFYIHPPGVPNYEFLDGDFSGLDEYLAAHDELVLPYPEAGNRFIEFLSEHRDGSCTNYLCIMFSYNYFEPTPPICLITDFGNMRAVDYGAEAYTAGYGDAPRQLKTKFKFVFDQPVTNKIIKWITYYYDYDQRAYVDYAVHQCEVTGKESGEYILTAEPSDSLRHMNMIVPTVDLNGDLDLDGDVDDADVILRAPESASLLISPTGQTNETPGSGVVPVTVGANVFALGMPESVLRIKVTGVESGEHFRLWSTTNSTSENPVALMVIGGGGGTSELIEDPPLLIDTEEGLEYAWPVKQQAQYAHSYSFICQYTYAPEFPKTLYLECVSCGATNDGRARIEFVYEYNGEEICSVALPITIIDSKLVPDWNHDRTIDMTDQNQSTNNVPFRFWINDDADSGDISEGDSDVPGHSGGLLGNANYKDGQVNGRSDLLDFFPVWLDIKSVLERYPVTNGAAYKLRQADEALKFVYTDLTCGNAGDFLIAETNTYGVAMNQNAYEATTIQITSSGITLSTNFLNRIAADPDKGILMIEATASSTAPLVLEIWQNGAKVWETSLALSLSGVEDMYRKVNLRNMQNPGVLPEPSNNPDSSSNGKNLVFLHGYQPDVGDSGDMSPWLSEMFKRFYQSGAKAKFHGVLWYSNQGDPMDYQRNVTNAFCTAPVLRDYVVGLDGDVVVAAHSLGNMVVSSAIADQNMSVSKYMMCDAAVASEAYDATMNQETSLVNEWWTDYSNRTWAANWHQLFADTGDSRTNLTWRSKFKRIVSRTEVFNFYSDGDEVFDLTPNQGLFAGTIGVDANWWFIVPVGVDVNINFGRYSWQKQELFKGCRYSDRWASFGGTSCGGWGFESDLQLTTWYGLPALTLVQTYTNAAGANMATDEQLRSNPVFDHGPNWLVGPGVLSQSQIDEMLGMGIPALTRSTGKTQIRTSVIPVERQFNLNSTDANAINFKPNGWPMRGDPDYQNWLHNDMITVAYFFNYKLFEEMVESGVIK